MEDPVDLTLRIGFSKIAGFFLKISKNDSNIICSSITNTQFSKIWWVWRQRYVRHAHLKFELQMVMAGPIDEPRPSNFAQKFIF